MLVAFAIREGENWGQGSCFQSESGAHLRFSLFSVSVMTQPPSLPWPPRTHQTWSGTSSLVPFHL